MNIDLAIAFLSGMFIYQPIINFGFIPSSAEGMTRQPSQALGYGLTGGIFILVYSFSSWLMHYYLLIPFNLSHMELPLMILMMWGWYGIIKSSLMKCAMFRYHMPFYFLNIAVLGSGLMLIYFTPARTLLALARSAGIAVGFLLANLLISFFQEKMEFPAFPGIMQGWPVYFMLCSIFWLSYYGLSLLF